MTQGAILAIQAAAGGDHRFAAEDSWRLGCLRQSRSGRQFGLTIELVGQYAADIHALPVGIQHGAEQVGRNSSPARNDSDVLLAVDRVSDRRRQHACLGVGRPQRLAGCRVIGQEPFIGSAMKDQVTGCRQDTAVFEQRLRDAPCLLLFDRIPCDQHALEFGHEFLGQIDDLARRVPGVHAEICTDWPRLEVLGALVDLRHLPCRYVNEA